MARPRPAAEAIRPVDTRCRLGLPSRPRFEFDDLVIVNHVADLYRPAADLAVFEIALASNREVQYHGDRFTAIRAFEKVFHSSQVSHLCIDISGWLL